MQNVLTKTAAVLAAALLAAAMAAGCGSGSAVKQQLDPRDDTQKR